MEPDKKSFHNFIAIQYRSAAEYSNLRTENIYLHEALETITTEDPKEKSVMPMREGWAQHAKRLTFCCFSRQRKNIFG